MTTLLEKTRQINKLLQQKNTFDQKADLPYDKMAMIWVMSWTVMPTLLATTEFC